MEPRDLRAKLVEDHDRLRAKLGGVESLALQVLRGDVELASALQRKAEELRGLLLEHMEWEDRAIAPRLRAPAMPAGGVEAEHLVQRERLGQLLVALRESRAPGPLARALLDFARALERDMWVEERQLLDSGVLSESGASGRDE